MIKPRNCIHNERVWKKFEWVTIQGDPRIRYVFEKFCKSTFCLEVVHFIETASSSRSSEQSVDMGLLKEVMLEIYNQFFSEDSPDELCIPEQEKALIRERINHGLNFDAVFQRALDICHKDLDKIICQFQTSSLYEVFERNEKLFDEIVKGPASEDAFKKLRFVFKTSEFIFYDVVEKTPEIFRFFKGNKICGTGTRDGFFLKIFDLAEQKLCTLPHDFLEKIPKKARFQTRERSKSISTLSNYDNRPFCILMLHSGSEFEIQKEDLCELRKFKIIPEGALLSFDGGKTYQEDSSSV